MQHEGWRRRAAVDPSTWCVKLVKQVSLKGKWLWVEKQAWTLAVTSSTWMCHKSKGWGEFHKWGGSKKQKKITRWRVHAVCCSRQCLTTQQEPQQPCGPYSKNTHMFERRKSEAAWPRSISAEVFQCLRTSDRKSCLCVSRRSLSRTGWAEWSLKSLDTPAVHFIFRFRGVAFTGSNREKLCEHKWGQRCFILKKCSPVVEDFLSWVWAGSAAETVCVSSQSDCNESPTRLRFHIRCS